MHASTDTTAIASRMKFAGTPHLPSKIIFSTSELSPFLEQLKPLYIYILLIIIYTKKKLIANKIECKFTLAKNGPGPRAGQVHFGRKIWTGGPNFSAKNGPLVHFLPGPVLA